MYVRMCSCLFLEFWCQFLIACLKSIEPEKNFQRCAILGTEFIVWLGILDHQSKTFSRECLVLAHSYRDNPPPPRPHQRNMLVALGIYMMLQDLSSIKPTTTHS